MVIGFYSLYQSNQSPFLKREYSLYSSVDCISAPEDIFTLVKELTFFLAEEHLLLIGLNSTGKILGISEVSHGTVNRSLINFKGIFERCLLMGASCMALVHNHPSGNVMPSNTDVQVTKRVLEACKLLEITFNDHLIVSGNNYYSFNDSHKELWS